MDVKKLLEKYKDELTVIGKAKMPKNMPWPPMPNPQYADHGKRQLPSDGTGRKTDVYASGSG